MPIGSICCGGFIVRGKRMNKTQKKPFGLCHGSFDTLQRGFLGPLQTDLGYLDRNSDT